MIKCILIDDEELAQEQLISKLTKIPNVAIVAVFNNAFDAIRLLNSDQINLVFCDIQLPDMNGVSLLKSLKNPPLFVFVTADPNYALEGYELNLLDYILKPFTMERLLKTIHKAQDFLAAAKAHTVTRNYMIIRDKQYNFITPYNEIYYIKADKDYASIWTKDKKHYVWRKLIDLEESLLEAPQFARVHKSYIVNLEYAEHVIGNIIKMKGSLPDIPIGGQYKTGLFNKLGIAVK